MNKKRKKERNESWMTPEFLPEKLKGTEWPSSDKEILSAEQDFEVSRSSGVQQWIC